MHVKEIWIGKKKDENNQNIAYEILEEPNGKETVKVMRVKDAEVLEISVKDIIDPFVSMLDYKFGKTHDFITKLSHTLIRE